MQERIGCSWPPRLLIAPGARLVSGILTTVPARYDIINLVQMILLPWERMAIFLISLVDFLPAFVGV